MPGRSVFFFPAAGFFYLLAFFISMPLVAVVVVVRATAGFEFIPEETWGSICSRTHTAWASCPTRNGHAMCCSSLVTYSDVLCECLTMGGKYAVQKSNHEERHFRHVHFQSLRRTKLGALDRSQVTLYTFSPNFFIRQQSVKFYNFVVFAHRSTYYFYASAVS